MAMPKLRFKDFKDDWQNNPLGKIIGISSASRVFKDQWQESGVPFFRTSDVVSIYKKKENEKAYISLELFEQLAKKSGKIQKDDLLVTGGGSIGIPYLVPNNEPLYFKDADLLWLKSYGIIEGSFLYNFFISPKFREYLKSISHTGTISHFTIEQAKATPFSFPSKEEQRKIASFLSAVDEKINQLTQKLHLLGQYKQGMMQKLFSQQIRFKADDGSEFGEWTFSKLNNYINESKDKSKYQDEYDVLTSSRKGLIKQTEYFEDSRLADRDNIGFNIIKQNEITYRSRSDDGLFFFNLNKLGITGIISTYYPVINMKNSDNRFFHAYLNFHKYEYVKYAVGTSQLVLSLNELRNMKFYIPCLAEQTKIANFLSAIDQKIEIAAQQIEQAKQWKKGLLQQMFV